MARNLSAREPIRHRLLSPRAAGSGAALLLLLAVGAGIYWTHRFALPPSEDALPRLHAMSAEATGGLAFDSSDNAVVRYRVAIVDLLGLDSTRERWRGGGNDLYRRWQEARRDDSINRLRLGVWGDPRHVTGLAMLAELRPVLDALDVASDAPHFRPRYSSSGDIFRPSDDGEPVEAVDILLRHLSVFRQFGELNAMRLRAAANTGDWDDAVRAVRTGLRMARHIAEEPFAISMLVGLSIDGITLDELRLTLGEVDMPPQVCDAMVAEIDAAGDLAVTPGFAASERMALGGAIRAVLLEEGGRNPFALRYWEARFGYPPPRDAMRDGARYFEALERFAAMSYAERTAEGPPTPGAAGWFIGAFAQTFQTADVFRTERAATVALLLLERHHRLTGAWPATLEQAMAPERAIEPNSRAPFVYLPGSDGLRPEGRGTVGDFTPSARAVAATQAFALFEAPEGVGPRWAFTLLAPAEAVFVRDPEFTRRRGPIVEHDSGDDLP